MKKTLLLLSLSVTLSAPVWAQSILNGNFENWTTNSHDEPNGWQNSNMESLRKGGILTCTKVTGVTGSAIKIETKLDPNTGDTIGGYFSNTLGDPTQGQGGQPYAQKPTGITGKYKSNMVGIDSALLLVIFKKSGSIISTNFYSLGGKNQTTFNTFNFSFSLPVTPDTFIIASASSNLLTNIGVSVGSNIVYDDLAFTGPGITQPIPNANFDAWTTITDNILTGWDMRAEPNSLLKLTDSYRGQYAIKLTTAPSSGGPSSANPASVCNGRYTNNGTVGRPFTNTVDTLMGYYKYATSFSDSAAISVSLKKNGAFVGGAFMLLSAKSTYTQFKLPFQTTTTPDTIIIELMSSKHPTTTLSIGSELTLDEVQLASAPLNTGLNTLLMDDHRLTIYPNPASNAFTIENLTSSADVYVYNLQGKEILHLLVKDGKGIDCSSLNAGLYYCVVKDTESNKVFSSKFIKE